MAGIRLFALIFMSIFGEGTSVTSRLDTYNVDNNGISVSGISSGAAMATQLHVIYSSDIMGAGLIAGVPFACSQGTVAGATACMMTPVLESVNTFIAETSSGAWLGHVDSVNHMVHDKVYIFSGLSDSVVKPGNGRNIQRFYEHYITDHINIKTEFNIDAEHCMPTEYFGGSCNTLNSNNYINNCGYNAAFDMLNFIYGGSLHKPTNGTALRGKLMTFDQTEFFHLSRPSTYSMDTVGYVYVPSGCVQKYTQCKLHVALHGCQMGRTRIGEDYVRRSGYNEVGEFNNIIILYPQAIANLVNLQGCWDWYGYTGIYYATNKGYQPTALKRMIDKINGSN